jgi:hypothetical protein
MTTNVEVYWVSLCCPSGGPTLSSGTIYDLTIENKVLVNLNRRRTCLPLHIHLHIHESVCPTVICMHTISQYDAQ